MFISSLSFDSFLHTLSKDTILSFSTVYFLISFVTIFLLGSFFVHLLYHFNTLLEHSSRVKDHATQSGTACITFPRKCVISLLLYFFLYFSTISLFPLCFFCAMFRFMLHFSSKRFYIVSCCSFIAVALVIYYHFFPSIQVVSLLELLNVFCERHTKNKATWMVAHTQHLSNSQHWRLALSLNESDERKKNSR